jgi:NADH-quinone oxidoreductase subunit A
MIEQFGYVAAYVGAGIVFLALILTIARLIRPNRPNVEKLSTYESGEAPAGNANIRFNPRFYVIALLFVLFEIELVFLFPTATLLKNKELAAAAPEFPVYAVVEILIFVGILAFGLAFAWVKGYLNWEKPESSAEKLNIPIPDSVYDNIRKKHSSPTNVL